MCTQVCERVRTSGGERAPPGDVRSHATLRHLAADARSRGEQMGPQRTQPSSGAAERERETDYHSGRRPATFPPLFFPVEQIVLPRLPGALDSSEGQIIQQDMLILMLCKKKKKKEGNFPFLPLFNLASSGIFPHYFNPFFFCSTLTPCLKCLLWHLIMIFCFILNST